MTLLALISESAAQDLATTDWNFYRGRQFNGHSEETGLVDSWPSNGPPVLWVRELGQGYSSFVGRGNRVFTMYQTVASQFVICLDSETGKTIWEHRYGWSYETAGLYPGPRSTPTLDGEHLYFTSPQGLLRCLKQSNGELVWEMDLFKKFGAEPVAFGYACSPVVVEEKVLLPVGGQGSAVVALNKSDGSVIWQAGDAKVSYASVLPIVRNDRKLLVAYLQNKLLLMDQENGQVHAEIELSNGYDEHSAWPIYAEPHLWISAPFREGSRLLKVSDSEPFEFKPVWQNDLLSNDVCSSVLVDGNLFGFDIFDVQSKVHRPSRGSYRCVDFQAGRSRWQKGNPRDRLVLDDGHSPAAKNSVGHCSTIYADGKLILFNDMGDLILVQADPDHFVELARVRVLGGQICWTQPMLLNQRLYLRNHKRAVCLYLGDPEALRKDRSSALAVADIPQDTSFDLAGLIFSVEPEYAMDAPTMDWMVKWYWVMLVSGWAIAFPIAVVASAITRRNKRLVRRIVFLSLAIVSGVIGTTVFSRWLDEFIFTWPLVLAIAFELLVFQMKSREQLVELKSNPRARRKELWLGRIALLAFLATCLVYFLLCRRLSLAFEWSFLLGFPAAIPFLLAARYFGKTSFRWGPSSVGLEWFFSGLAFTAFYWTGVLVVALKY